VAVFKRRACPTVWCLDGELSLFLVFSAPAAFSLIYSLYTGAGDPLAILVSFLAAFTVAFLIATAMAVARPSGKGEWCGVLGVCPDM